MIIDAPKPSHRPALRALWKEAFGDTDEFLDTFEKTAFSPDRCRCISEGNEILATLYWFDCSLHSKRIAYLYAVATARAHRGKGLCRQLMENTHAHLAAHGYAAALLVPGEKKLFSFYEKLGYRVCSHIGELSCRASDIPTALRQIDIKEYAERRRSLLPPNGILQENKNLTFLQAQASLYAGEDFLLAARREGESLYGVEWLGDTKKIPTVLRTLGYAKGRFRISKVDTPFAMYYPLENKAPTPPFYFGLAFD